MSNTTPRYSIDLYALFDQEAPAQEEQPQTGLMPRPTGQQATPDAEQEGYSPYGFLPTMAELIDAEYPQGLSRATLPTMDRFSVQQEELNAYLTPLQEALQTRPVGDTETVRPQMRPEREVEEVQPVEVTEEVATTEASTDGAGLMSRRLDDKGETPINFMNTGTFKLLQGVEGFKSQPYSLNGQEKIGGKPHKSGLTVGAGIDFGQHTRESLESIGLPKTMLDKAESAGWIGLNPDTIIDPDTGAPAATRKRGHELMFAKFTEQKTAGTLPNFTEGELSLATPRMYKPYEDSARAELDARHGEGTYDALSEGSKAVLSLEKYHRGTGYSLPNAMLDGAASGDPLKAAEGISWSSRKKNMKDWLKKVGLTVDYAPETSPRPQPRPERSNAPETSPRPQERPE